MKKIIHKVPTFLSLGSHYDWQAALFAIKSFFQINSNASVELREKLDLQADDDCVFTYKGRDALEVVLRSLSISVGDCVMTQAFSCSSLEEAIGRVGAKSYYFDLADGTLAPSPDSLQQSWVRISTSGISRKSIKAIIFQGSLGSITCWSECVTWAKKHDLFVIADLAQVVGSEIPNMNQVDAVIYSSGRDKIWDAVDGGVAVVRPTVLTTHFIPEGEISTFDSWRTLTYPMLTWTIRSTYSWGIGKMLHWLTRYTSWFESPIKSRYQQAKLISPQILTFMNYQWNKISDRVVQARLISRVYYELLGQSSPFQKVDLEAGSCLRFPVLVTKPQLVIDELKSIHVYISDRWYRSPVDSGTSLFETEYQVGSCPIAEQYADHMINLPTHHGVNEQIAVQIALVVSKYLLVKN